MKKYFNPKPSTVQNLRFLFYARFSTSKQTFFAKKLSFLIKAGVPMLESLEVIKSHTKSKQEIKVLEQVMAHLSNGQTLASSLGKFKKLFGNFAINIIKAGEASGTLTQNLAYLAEELKKKDLLKKKVVSALLYPIIVTVATLGITALLTLYIFPKILPIFASLNAKLPWSTRTIIFLTDIAKGYGFYILLTCVLLGVGFYIAIQKITKVRFFFDGFVLKIPIFGTIAKTYNLTNTTRTLGLLLKSGMSLSETILVTADTTENVQYQHAFLEVSRNTLKGKNMSETLRAFPKLFPPMVGHMISIGEKSGNLSNALTYLSEFYENEFDEMTKNLSSAIEPVLMIVMGIIVGFVAISVITPIYEITNSLKI